MCDMVKLNRKQEIDIARGIAIILVVLGHAIAKTSELDGMLLPRTLKSTFDIIYGFHMPLMFFISGIFINNSIKGGFQSFVRKKINRLVVPYFIWVFITVFIKILTSRYQYHQRTWVDFFLSPFIPFEQYYFIYVAFFLSLFYFFLGQKDFLFFACVSYFSIKIIPDVWVTRLLVSFALYFALGSVFNQFTEKYGNCFYKKSYAIFTYVIFILHSFMLSSMVAFIGILFTLQFSHLIFTKKIFSVCTILDWCGRKSMQIYCMHPIFMGIIRIISHKIIGIDYPYLMTITQLIFALVLSWLVLKVCATYDVLNNIQSIIWGDKNLVKG